MTNEEKRGSTRFSIKQLIDISAEGDVFISAKGVDLSTGGLSCEANKPLEPMTPVYIMLGLPFVAGEHLVKCEGYVAHSRMENGKCVVGIEFTDMPEEYRSMLEEYLSALGHGA
ncbi:MAG: PilZ domain-containing protein [Treponemataceae bacterium]